MANEKSLGAELVRLSGRSEDCFWLGERKDSGKGGAFSFSVANFMTHFLELVSLCCVLLCDCGRGDGLGFAGFDFRFRWSSGGPFLCSFRKRIFQEVTYKTSFLAQKRTGFCAGFCAARAAFWS